MKPAKKSHPHGLPHLDDATSHEELVAGSAAWASHVGPGKQYEFVSASETALDDNHDALTIIRKKNH